MKNNDNLIITNETTLEAVFDFINLLQIKGTVFYKRWC